MTKRVLYLGTKNRKKRDELEELLALADLELRTLEGLDAPDIVEDGETFIANAIKKATVLSKHLGQWVLGEDSGIEVDALGGAPGIFSARYSGEPCDDERNNDKMLTDLGDTPSAERTARYTCTIAVTDPSGIVRATAVGHCEGEITFERRGTGGFGYDPLFLIREKGQTFGELPREYKQSVSHRSQAVKDLRPQLLELLKTW